MSRSLDSFKRILYHLNTVNNLVCSRWYWL